MAGEELTRFPITPQERHRTAESSDDIAARPEEQQPNRRVENPPDKPLTPPADRSADDPDEIEERGGADD